MVRVGDTYKCDKSRIPRTENYDSYLSKGKFTLLNLGPRYPNSSYFDDSILVKDCNGVEAWASFAKFISYKRGQRGMPNGIAKQWMTREQLTSARARAAERQAAAAASSSTSNAAAPADAPVSGTILGSPSLSSDVSGSDPRQEREGDGPSRVPGDGVNPRGQASTSGNANQIPSASGSRSDGSVPGARNGNSDQESVPEVNERQDARPIEPSSSSKKRTADQMEEDHLKQLKKLQEEESEAIKKIKMEQERKTKMLKLEHNVEMLNTKLEEAKRELEEFKAEGNAD